MVLAKPGTITPHKKFESEVYILGKDEGEDILHFSQDTDLSFMFVQLM